jgi:hypothetical protein
MAIRERKLDTILADIDNHSAQIESLRRLEKIEQESRSAATSPILSTSNTLFLSIQAGLILGDSRCFIGHTCARFNQIAKHYVYFLPHLCEELLGGKLRRTAHNRVRSSALNH